MRTLFRTLVKAARVVALGLCAVALDGVAPSKLSKFEFRQRLSPSVGEPADFSELTVVHKDTGQSALLILSKVTDVATIYQLPQKGPK